MRKSILGGLLLAVVAGGMVLLSSALDLNLENVALLGAACGGVAALVPDRSPWARLGGFWIGFVVAWIGYFVRAAMLPDTSNARALVVAVVVAICVAVAAATRRIPLWALLLGAGAIAGAYEFTYNQNPPQVLSTSMSTAATMFLNVMVAFLAVSAIAPVGEADHSDERPVPEPGGDKPLRPAAAEGVN